MAWFKCYESKPEAAVRLFCFPHGGGGPHVFKSWRLGPSIEVTAISLPGRGLRANEPAISDIDLLSSEIANAMETDRPYALLGHSVGALLAYEVAMKLQKQERLGSCLKLFASAHDAPHLSKSADPMYSLSDEKLIKVISELGLIPEDLLANDELMAMFLDPIRADFEFSETYSKPIQEPLKVDLVAMGGSLDPIVTPESLQQWNCTTMAAFEAQIFEGDHFYLLGQEKVHQFITDTLTEKLASYPKSVLHGKTDDYPKDLCLHQIFSQRVETCKDLPAVVDQRQMLTFGQLDQITDLLAKHLKKKGADIGKPVGIYMEHCSEYVIAYLAILKAGAAYVPIEVAYPEAMIAKTVEAVNPVLILTRGQYKDLIKGEIFSMDPGWENGIESDPEPLSYEGHHAEMPAYYVMTSGTTGEPKGIVCPHRGAVNSYFWRYKHYPYTDGEREACNVFFVWEAIRSILQGIPSYVIPDDTIYDPHKLEKFLSTNQITRILFTPSLLEQTLNSNPNFNGSHISSLRIAYLNGEVVTTELSRKFLERFPGVKLLNDYSISECHDVCTLELAKTELKNQYAPLGKPMSNVSVYILDEQFQPVPLGCKGEVYVGGDSLAIGYLNQPQKTAERFLPDNIRGYGTMFRTGDGGRIKADGDLEIMGRLQFMIKLRGYTIVPDAVATVIKSYPGITGTVIQPDLNPITGQPERLVAYIVLSEPSNKNIIHSLREFLKKELPYYSIPGRFEILSEMPISSVTGKVDLKLLPKSEHHITENATKKAVNTVEGQILSIWQELLETDEDLDPEDNFFDLGGHSLLAIKMADKLADVGIQLSIADIFEHGTAKQLAELIRQSNSDEEEVELEGKVGREIAIIGLSCKFPGVEDLDSFWKLLSTGGCSIRQFSEEELLQNGVSRSLFEDSSYINAGSALESPFDFDPDFWGISGREAEIMDPQQRLFLQCAWEALENAGHVEMNSRSHTGIFAGSYLPTYLLNHLKGAGLTGASDPASFHLTEIGNDKDYLTTRASFLLNCTGPSLAIQTSCSTSLVAVATACQFLQTGQCNLAIAGASSITFPQGGYQYQEGHVLSPDGKIRAFDAKANGTILGDGVGVLILKRLEDAVKDEDHIHAVIKGFAINNDGQAKNGYSSPSVKGQMEVISRALRMAGVDAEEVSYVEGHGTGTIIGDAIEVEALSKAFRRQTEAKQYCGLGSVKPNIGHSNIAAGMGGLAKLVLAFQHKQLPPTINYECANPCFNIEESPFKIQSALEPWNCERKRIAGISSFGIGGTNCHMILEEPPAVNGKKKTAKRELLTFSAKSKSSLVKILEKMIKFLKENRELALADLGFTLRNGRQDFPAPNRAAFTASSLKDCVENLRKKVEKMDPEEKKQEKKKKLTSVVFMFPGQGAQYPMMGKQLYDTVTRFRTYFDDCSALFAEKGVDVRSIVFENGDLGQTSNSQPAIFTVEYALAKTLIDWGLVPKAVIGHSIGEYVAATVAGVVSLENAVALVSLRAKAMEAAPEGRMLSVNSNKEELDAYLENRQDIWLAVENSGSDFVLAGTEKAVQEAAAKFPNSKQVHVNHAFHTELMKEAAEVVEKLSEQMQMNPPKIPMASNLFGGWLDRIDGSYWSKQMLNKVQFAKNVQVVAEEFPDIMLEVGPSRILKNLTKKIIKNEAIQVFSTMPHPKEEIKSYDMLLEALASLWESGVDVDWTKFDEDSLGTRVPLPTYQFDNKVCYPASSKIMVPERSSNRLPIHDRFYVPVWTNQGAIGQSEATNGWEDTLLSNVGCFESVKFRSDGDKLSVVVEISESRKNGDAMDRFHSFLTLIQRLSQHQGDGVLWIYGQNMLQVEKEAIDLSKSVLLPPAMVFSQEFPNWNVRVVDCDIKNAGLTTFLDEDAKSFSVSAIRNGLRWVPQFQKVQLPAEVKSSGAVKLKRDGVYIITGGFGRIGFALALHLAKHGSKLILTTRQNPESMKIKEKLNELNHPAKALQVDFGKPRDIKRLLCETLATHGRIDGIFHAAGLAELKYVEELNGEIAEREFEPKVFGTTYLKEAIGEMNNADVPEFVLLFSSMASILGGYGMSAYAAANRFLDAFAAENYQQGRTHWMAVNWDDWAFDYEKEQTEGYAYSEERQLAMTAEEGFEALERVLAVAFNYPQILVVTSPLEPRLSKWHSIAVSARPAKPAAVVVEERPKNESEIVATIYREVLGVEEMDPEGNFFDLGGDSLMAAQILLQLQKRLSAKVHLKDVFQHPSVKQMSDHLSRSRSHSPA